MSSLLYFTPPASAAPASWVGGGTYYSGNGQCAQWLINANLDGPDLGPKLTGATLTRQGAGCGSSLLLPAGWINVTQFQWWWWNGSAWVVRYSSMSAWTNAASTDAAPSTGSAGISVTGSSAGFWYPRVSHNALLTGGVKSFVSGAASPILSL